MKMPVLSVKDCLVGFGSPFTSVNKDVAIRGFNNSIIQSLKDGDSNYPCNPEDLSLYLVGEFDCDTGDISPIEPCVLVRGSAIVLQYRRDLGDNFIISGGDFVNDI